MKDNPYRAPATENAPSVRGSLRNFLSILALLLGVTAFVAYGSGDFMSPAPFLLGFVLSSTGFLMGLLGALLQTTKRYAVVVALLFNTVLMWKTWQALAHALNYADALATP